MWENLSFIPIGKYVIPQCMKVGKTLYGLFDNSYCWNHPHDLLDLFCKKPIHQLRGHRGLHNLFKLSNHLANHGIGVSVWAF